MIRSLDLALNFAPETRRSTLKRLARNLRTALYHPPGYLIRRRLENQLVDQPNYTYGMLRAADVARFWGKKKVTVCEFGLATGHGLMKLVELVGRVTETTGVEFRIVGLDTGRAYQ